ncbi:OB-fold domain-containing protein [Streptomyces hirsutus]|uniref:OB-fold domain-containing protein n=1 Tax=Streptomyces hirsutus TaxID=35620 RepID=UPI00369BF1F9
MTHTLQAYATYLPAWRLSPASTGARSTRVVASFDEDSTTMAVEAAGALLSTLGPGTPVPSLHFATTSPAYLDKTNAVAVHAALGLDETAFAVDVAGSGRSAFAALRGALTDGGLAVAADVRVGKPGSTDERSGGDGAAALLFGPGPGIARVLARYSLSAEFLDRWREPTSTTGEQWEERFGFERYADLIRRAARETLVAAGVDEADHVVVTSPNAGVTKRAGTLVKGRLSTGGSPIGFSGAADTGLALASVLDVAGPEETILVLSAVDGCDVLLLRTTGHLPARRQRTPVREQLGRGREIPHLTYLAWRGLVERELPRRPEPDRPAGPPSDRAAGWKFGFNGSRCTDCGFVHLPPLRVCRRCGTADAMEPVPGTRLRGTVATHTVDHLAYSPSPPVVVVVADFDGGGRTSLELADPDPEALTVGSRVEPAFRRFFTARGVHNYFWKARPSTGAAPVEGSTT